MPFGGSRRALLRHCRISESKMNDKELGKEIRARKATGKNRMRIACGDCLFLQLSKKTDGSYSMRWVFRRRSNDYGKEVERSLGTYPQMTMANAKKEALAMRQSFDGGKDPAEVKRKEEALAVTFESAGRAYVDQFAPLWKEKNKRREQVTLSALVRNVFPVIGSKPVNDICADDVLRVLLHEDFLLKKTWGASKGLCNVINNVCVWARAKGWRESVRQPKPASLAGDSDLSMLLRPWKQYVEEYKNHPGIGYERAPEFFGQLISMPYSPARNAVILGMLCGLRADAFLSVRLSNIDEDERVLVIPEAHRKTKGRGAFLVYLSSYAFDFLKAVPQVDGYLFSCDGGRTAPCKGTTVRFLAAMNKERRAAGLDEWIEPKRADGEPRRPARMHAIIRSSFSSFAKEEKHGTKKLIDREAVELCLDHSSVATFDDKHGGAYIRLDMKDGRRDALEKWGRFLITGLYPSQPGPSTSEQWQRLLSECGKGGERYCPRNLKRDQYLATFRELTKKEREKREKH